MSTRTWLAVRTWAAITLAFQVIAFVTAEYPEFQYLLALISSLFASWFTHGLSSIF
jgi:hypothetical protein